MDMCEELMQMTHKKVAFSCYAASFDTCYAAPYDTCYAAPYDTCYPLFV